MTKPLIASNVDSLDPLTEVPFTWVKGRNLREGMIVLDHDLNTPAAWLDNKGSLNGRAGIRTWGYHELDTNRYRVIPFGVNAEVKVMSR